MRWNVTVSMQPTFSFSKNIASVKTLTLKCGSNLIQPSIFLGGRRGGLMVSALDSGASGPGSSPGRGHCVVFLGKTLYSTQVYKWVPGNCWGNLAKLRGSDLRWTSIPSRGSRNTSSRFMLQKPG